MCRGFWVGQRAVSARWPGGVGRFASPCLSRSRCGPVPGLGGPVPGVDHYRRRRAKTGPTTGEDYRPGPASDLARVGWLYRGFLALRDFQPCRASLLPCGGLSPALWGFVPARSLRGFWRASVGRGWLGWDCLRACGVYLGRRACPVYPLPCFALSLPVPCL